MVTWIKDATGRFPHRPFYEDDELEGECEAIIRAHFRTQGAEPSFPIPTNELMILLEKEASTLDVYSELEPGVDGQTDFCPDGSTVVQIARHLGDQEFRENRLRTTLTHELAHIKFHERMFRSKSMQPSLFGDSIDTSARCRRSNIIDSSGADWLEWQAGFASTSILMPRSLVTRVVQDVVATTDASGPIVLSSPLGSHLLRLLQRNCGVSREAATIRLLRLKYATNSVPHQPML